MRITVALVAAAISSPTFAFDPHEPIALERAARELLLAGDRDTACILVDRAARISPHDRRIAANIDELEAMVIGSPRPAPPPPPAAARPASGVLPEIPPAPPALWQVR